MRERLQTCQTDDASEFSHLQKKCCSFLRIGEKQLFRWFSAADLVDSFPGVPVVLSGSGSFAEQREVNIRPGKRGGGRCNRHYGTCSRNLVVWENFSA